MIGEAMRLGRELLDAIRELTAELREHRAKREREYLPPRENS